MKSANEPKQVVLGVLGRAALVVAIAGSTLVASPAPASAGECEAGVWIGDSKTGIFCGDVINNSNRSVRIADNRCWASEAPQRARSRGALPCNRDVKVSYENLGAGKRSDQKGNGFIDTDAFMAEGGCLTSFVRDRIRRWTPSHDGVHMTIDKKRTSHSVDRRGMNGGWLKVENDEWVTITQVKCQPLAGGGSAPVAGAASVQGGYVDRRTTPASGDSSPCTARVTRAGRQVQFCPLWRGNVPVYDSPDKGGAARQVGTLVEGGSTNWFVGQERRSSISVAGYTNNWWAFTLADNGAWGWVPEVYFQGGADNERDAGLAACDDTNRCSAGSASTAAPPSRVTPPPPAQGVRPGRQP